ncbi:transcriptional regulator [Alkalihalobacillus xiaoxiensis]|uniref:Transcriptional regulator n=1 Tax=Shouchella xiaoxiensis TaxID=766895 RepID=A0ABS2SNU4_9BACI|nr:FMN-binding negative transcriptional regulator [Shouchella xiaoxiensis]MBM7836821.1 transcriptional regulator [Shouchella xiaoxiensis]
MYSPTHFKMTDKETMISVIKNHSFATVISQVDGVPEATHLPLQINKEGTYLYGHFARPNPQWKSIRNQTVLAIFHGPHCYISPSWYETNKAVPTWNYVTVHVHGEMILLDDETDIRDSLTNLIAAYEAEDSTYDVTELDATYLKNMSKGIQAFKLKIERLEGKAKLSQNHSQERQALVRSQLKQSANSDEQQIAKWMEKTH